LRPSSWSYWHRFEAAGKRSNGGLVGKIRGNYGKKWDNPNITFKWWKMLEFWWKIMVHDG